MILIDSCVWIDNLSGRSTHETQFLGRINNSEFEICTSGIIFFEVLRGIADLNKRRQVKSALKNLPFYNYSHHSFEKILHYDLLCRRHGVTLPKLGDWLIIQTALEHNLELLSSDKDFKKVLPWVPIKLIQI